MAKLVARLMIYCFALIFSIEPGEFEKQSYVVTPAFFVSSQAAFEWTFGPQVLRSIPVVLRRVIDTIWDPGDDALVQPDEIFGDDVQSSFSNVSFVLETYRNFDLKFNQEECSKMKFLSYRIPEEGTDMDKCPVLIGCCC